jgi:hypothetical protein
MGQGDALRSRVAGNGRLVIVMSKLSRFLIVAAILGCMGGGAYAAWFFRGQWAGAPKTVSPARAEYDRFVGRLGGDESTIRDELNFLASTTSAPLGEADQSNVRRLTRECLDPNVLLDIEHVHAFVGSMPTSGTPAYHFVGGIHKQRLQAIAGDNPSPERVIAVRKALATLGDEFGLIRQPPDWKVEVVEKEGAPPPMPFLELLRSGSHFLSAGKHPDLRAEPRISAFGGPDGELLVQLEQFFNTPQARAALPLARFSTLYRDGRIPPIPTNLDDYQKQMEEAVGEEMRLLLPGDNPDPEGIEAVKEVYGKLQRFFTAIVQFDPK